MSLPKWAPIAMAGWRDLGETYQQIGDRFGVSRERVRQLLVKIGKAGVLPRPEFCVVPGCDQPRCRGSRRYCSLHAGRVSNTGAPGPAVRLKNPAPTHCVDCGARLAPNGQRSRQRRMHAGCGRCRACYSRARYAAMTPEQKARHAALCLRWQKSHPEQAAEIQRRASRAYYLRKKAAQQEQQP